MKNEKREFVFFLTNATHISALQVAELYKKTMTSGTVFQMAEAAPQNQKVLRYYRECRSDTNLRCYMHLLPGRNCSTRHATG